MPRLTIPALICALISSAALVGCSRDSGRTVSHHAPPPKAKPAYDAIWHDDPRMRDLLLVTDPQYGPDHMVVISARVPETFYADGAIHMTNGRELRVVSPRAWSAYTGTALTAREAQEVIARAHSINQASEDYRRAIAELRSIMEGHAAAAGVARAEAFTRAEHLRSQAHVVETREDLERLITLRMEIARHLDQEMRELSRLRETIDTRRNAAEVAQASDIATRRELTERMAQESAVMEGLRQRLVDHRSQVGTMLLGLEASQASSSALETELDAESRVLGMIHERIIDLSAVLEGLSAQLARLATEDAPALDVRINTLDQDLETTVRARLKDLDTRIQALDDEILDVRRQESIVNLRQKISDVELEMDQRRGWAARRNESNTRTMRVEELALLLNDYHETLQNIEEEHQRTMRRMVEANQVIDRDIDERVIGLSARARLWRDASLSGDVDSGELLAIRLAADDIRREIARRLDWSEQHDATGHRRVRLESFALRLNRALGSLPLPADADHEMSESATEPAESQNEETIP